VRWLFPFIQSEFGAKGSLHLNLGRPAVVVRTTLWQQSQQGFIGYNILFLCFWNSWCSLDSCSYTSYQIGE